MKKVIVFSKLALAGFLFAGALTVTAEAARQCPGDGICPAVYDPVICNDGVVYSNDCYARNACATGCKPYNG